MIYIYGPAELVPLYVGSLFAWSPAVPPLLIADPEYEAENVPNRRAFISHDLSSDATSYARAVIHQNGHDGLLTVADKLPADWRYRVLPDLT